MEPPPEYYEAARRRSGSRGDEMTGQYNMNFTGQPSATGQQQSTLHGHMAQMVFDAGSAQMKQAYNTYARIDYLRPYFDVEPKTVRNRLLQSLVPRPVAHIQPPNDLYGPFMLIFTLVALLLFTMKTSNFQVQEGTLIGTALITCFGYWASTSIVIATMAYVFLCDLPIVTIAATIGYALFGHCIVIALTALFHPLHDHLYFFVLLAMFAGASCLRMGIIFASKARHRTHKLILLITITILHCTFLAYLHFGFETMVEEIDDIIGHDGAARIQGTLIGSPDALKEIT